MREFYCPGSLVFRKNKNHFLTYKCKSLISNDYLFSQNTLPNITDIDPNHVFLKTDTLLIYKDGQKIIISFLVPTEEMQKAIGYFDYNEKDKDLVKGKYWVDETIIFQK